MITLELPYDVHSESAESLPDDHLDVVRAHCARDPACELKLR
jgi:hypothetical protein